MQLKNSDTRTSSGTGGTEHSLAEGDLLSTSDSRKTILRRWDIAVVVGFAVLLWAPRLSGPIDLRYDAGVYYLLGTSLASGHGYRIPSEPGTPEALQYPPLLPAIAGAYQWALGTSDAATVGPWLRRSYALLFVLYALAVLALARRYLPSALAVTAAALCLLHHQSIFLSDLLFAELPFALVAVAFALVAGSPAARRPSWLREGGAFALAAIGFLLRTAGIALLAAWVLEAFVRRQWRTMFLRGAVALVPVIAWQSYVAHVRASDEYAHPAYQYQRAPYQYYNVSYAENALLLDPFRPELGRVTGKTIVRRLAANIPNMVEAVGQAVSTTKVQWVRVLSKTERKLLHRSVIPPGVVSVPMFCLAAFVILGLLLLFQQKSWLVGFVVVASLALVWTTPWPAQFSRYLAPLIAFLDICFILAWSRIRNSLSAQLSGRARTVLRAAMTAVLLLAFAMETYTAVRLFHARHLPGGVVWVPGKGDSYRLFAHDPAWRAWEKAVDWISTNGSKDAIVATTAPHFLYLLSGRRAVLPPMESDPARARLLLAGVPAAYVIIDELEFLDISRRYARPAVKGDAAEWRLVHSVDGTQTYGRTPAP